jgi:replicative DNA helicase
MKDKPQIIERRVLPYSIDAEQAVLGGLLVDPDAFARIVKRPSVSDFYEPRHREIYQAITDLDKQNLPFDLITVSTEMSKQALYYNFKAYLMELTSACPTSANIKFYADTVIEKALLRNIITMADDVKKRAFEADVKGDELLSLTERKILDLSESKMQVVQSIDTIADQLINNLVAGRTGVKARVADDSLLCVVKGTGEALNHLETYKKTILSKR